MNEITSTSNSKIKELVKLHQNKYLEQSDSFLIEGIKSYEELLDKKIDIKQVFILKTSLKKFSNISADKITIVDEHVMKKLASTDSAPEIIVLAKKRESKILDLTEKNLLICLENIKDAGNLGTIIRSAAAFEIDGIVLLGDTVQHYNPKVIRSSAGNFFKVPIIKINSADEFLKEFKSHKLIATSLLKENEIKTSEIDFNAKNIILFGSEAKGLSEVLTKSAACNIKIEHSKNVESLNISIAASIIMSQIYNAKIS